MKIVNLAAPTTVYDTHGFGTLRSPVEGPLTVSDEEAKRLGDNNLLDEKAEDVPEDKPKGKQAA
jgi:hypothetical protein